MANEHPDGIFFGLPADEYHADPAFSATGVKDMSVGPANYWRRSILNPDREEREESAALEYGTALHARLLEGRDAFEARYATAPNKDDHPDAIDGVEALRELCGKLEIKRGGTIAEMCERILVIEPEAALWPVVRRRHEEANEGKILLSDDTAKKIEATAACVASHPDASKALSGGYPEVSIFWTDETEGVPVRMKSRLDRLKTKAVVDLKSFTNPRNKWIDRAVADSVATHNYHVQGVTYCGGIETVKGLLRRGECVVSGDVEPGFIEALKASDEHRFYFVFVENSAHPAIRVKRFDRAISAKEETLYWQKGAQILRSALETYRVCLKTFGPDRPWPDSAPMGPFSDEDFPLWMTE